MGEAVLAHQRADDWKHVHRTPEQVAEHLMPYHAIGYRHYLANFPAPYDDESMARFATEVRPMLT